MFKRKKNKSLKEKGKNIEKVTPSDNKKNNSKFSKPNICSFNLRRSDNYLIEEAGFRNYNGSFGAIVEVNNEYNKGHYLLLNNDIPDNLHEYDILIFDLINKTEVQYNSADHQKKYISTSKDLRFYCSYPKNIFDPRPYSGFLIKDKVSELQNRDSIIIIFANSKKSVEYQIANNDGHYANIVNTFEKDNYSFLPNGIRFSKNKSGRSIKINEKIKIFEGIFSKYCQNMEYKITFYHPIVWQDNKNVKSSNFIPLLYNNLDEIIGYAELNDKQWIFVFPEMESKGLFLKDIFEEALPGIIPQLFPDHQKALWTTRTEYLLPNENSLNKEKESILERHRIELEEIDQKISSNKGKYSFLHNLLNTTGDELVKNVIYYLEWLGFDKVINMDETNPERKEEDIQIELNNGLLIIEAKGIGGTSKDDECAQITKIRSRRCEERGKFDVYGLYVVNHQRHLPPLDRKNPPFTEDQLRDAIINKRGLLTTWQLFNLYFNIKEGTITKEQARNDLLKIGYIEFDHNCIIKVGKVTEIFQKGEIIIIENVCCKLQKDDSLFVKNNERFIQIKIESLQVDSKEVNEVSSGDVGIKIDTKLKVGEIVYSTNSLT